MSHSGQVQQYITSTQSVEVIFGSSFYTSVIGYCKPIRTYTHTHTHTRFSYEYMLCACVGKNGWNGIFFHKANQYSAPVVQGGQWTVDWGQRMDGSGGVLLIDTHLYSRRQLTHGRLWMENLLLRQNADKHRQSNGRTSGHTGLRAQGTAKRLW